MNLRTWTTLAVFALAAPAAALAQQAHPAAHATKADAKKAKTVEIAVTSEGFTPAAFKVKAGETVRLVVTRKTDKTCATEIVIPGYGINQKLPLDKAVTVELTPKASGEIKYACGMDMITGVILVP